MRFTSRHARALIRKLTPWLLVMLVGLLSLQRSVCAQGGHANETDGEARVLFERGSAAYEHGDYAEAKRYFEAAYTLSGRPRLLYNVALADDHLRQDEGALRAYRAYLEALPEAGNRDEVRARIAVLEHAQAQKEPAPQIATPREAAQSLSPSGAIPTAPESDREGEHGPVYKRWWLWTTVAAVAVGAGVGFALAMRRPESATESALPGDNGLVVQTLGLR